jgi:hypothetical protein
MGLLAGFLLLTSRVVEIHPFPTYFATGLLLVGTALAIRLRSTTASLASLGLTLLLASFARPEFTLSFLLFCSLGTCAGLWALWKYPATRLQVATAAIVVLVGTASLVAVFGNPLGGSRSFYAFGQHYALNVLQSQHRPICGWAVWEQFVAQDFGDAKTVSEALWQNPQAFGWHMGVNLRKLPGEVAWLIKPQLNLSPRGHLGLRVGLIAAGLLGTFCVCWRLARSPWNDEGKRRLPLALLMLLILFATTAASVLVVYPRRHYLLPTVAFAYALVGSCLSRSGPPNRSWLRGNSWPVLTTLALVLFMVMPNRAHTWDLPALLWGRRVPHPAVSATRATVETLQQLRLHGPVVVLEFGFGWSCYAGLPAKRVNALDKNEGFWRFVREKGINVMILIESLSKFDAYRDDPEFQEFLAGTRTEDFKLVPVPGTKVQIAVRRDLLPAESGETDAPSGGGQ